MRLEVFEAHTQPRRTLAGGRGEFLAIREQEPGKFLVVAYRELENDGFVMTAFLAREMHTLNRRGQIWPLQMFKSS